MISINHSIYILNILNIAMFYYEHHAFNKEGTIVKQLIFSVQFVHPVVQLVGKLF